MKRSLCGKKVVAVMPAYNASLTLKRTVDELPLEFLKEVIMVDDASCDNTLEVGERLGIRTVIHEENLGYGANQKTCFSEALKAGADIVVMIHPDYQYSPRLVMTLSAMVASGEYDMAIGSRFIGVSPVSGGMPIYKYISNRLLTELQNIVLKRRHTEYHTGFRAYSREVLENLPWQRNSDDFVFDNQIIAQAVYANYRIGEISCPSRYFPEASSIGLSSSVRYGFGVLATSMHYMLARRGLYRRGIFEFSA